MHSHQHQQQEDRSDEDHFNKHRNIHKLLCVAAFVPVPLNHAHLSTSSRFATIRNVAPFSQVAFRPGLTCLLIALLGSISPLQSAFKGDYFEIDVVDEQTARGVPLVELETVNHLRFVTDSAGRVAFYEPGLMNQPVFFYVRSHGYEFPKDGFGYPGVRLETKSGERTVVRIKRLNIAERLYRVTGESIYRD